MSSTFLLVCCSPPITIFIGRRAGLVAKAETADSDVAPCHTCAKVLVSVGLLCLGLGLFCDKSLNLSVSVL